MTATIVPILANNLPTLKFLDSGLTIVAQSMPVNAVNLNVWLKVGSFVESHEINGMAHYLEHMIFKGTSKLKGGDFEKLVEARGAVTNAGTSQEYTNYYITSAPQDFSALAPLQLEVLFNASLDSLDFEREKGVILEEIRRADDNPQRRIFQKVLESCFPNLPYCRPVLGTSEIIQGLKTDQMVDFHHRWYQPANMTVVAVGNLPVEELIDTVEQGIAQTYIGQTRPLAEENLPQWLPEKPFEKISRTEVQDPSLQQARLVMFWRVPGTDQLVETYGLDVLAAILGQGKMSRLYRDLREEQGLVSQVSAHNSTQILQGIFYLSVRLPVENLAQVEDRICFHLEKLRLEAVTVEEIERIRTQVVNRFIFSSERPSDRANLYGYYQSLLGSVEPALNYPTLIQALDPDQLQSTAKTYLDPKAYGVVVSKP